MPIRMERQGDAARIVLEFPPMNQLDRQARSDLADALTELAAGPDLRVLVLTGAGDQAFCAGADIRELAEIQTAEAAGAYAAAWDEIYRQIRDFPCPTVAAVGGYALGGGFEILLNTDIRIAAGHARLGCTAANIGLVTSIHSLAAQLPPPVAKELFYTARHITADEALQIGLVNRVVPGERLAETVAEVAREICLRAPLAVRRGKALFASAAVLDRAAHDRRQQGDFADLAVTADHREGVGAFLEKRRPVFQGK